MQRMCHIPEAARQFRQHQTIVSNALNDNDVSLRRRALDVLYSMCDTQNSEKVRSRQHGMRPKGHSVSYDTPNSH